MAAILFRPQCVKPVTRKLLPVFQEGGPQGQQNATRDQLKDMARIVNHTGYTPLLTACQAYANGLVSMWYSTHRGIISNGLVQEKRNSSALAMELTSFLH